MKAMMKRSRVSMFLLSACVGWVGGLGCVPEGAGDNLSLDESAWGEELEAPQAVDVVVRVDPGFDDASADERTMFAQIAVGATVFLNREGRVYVPANRDDSAAGYSSVLAYQRRGAVRFPPAGYNPTQWADLVSRVRAHFAPFNIQVVDRRPATGTYVEVAIGNSYANVLGLPNNIGGIAPIGPCVAIRNSIGYVFHALYDRPGYGGIAGTAEAIAHEVGHSLSLSHESYALDLMSYAPQSAQKGFQNAASYCGTRPGAEACSCGGPTQNSHQQLMQMVGPRQDVPTDPTNPPPPTGDTTPPTVTITSPADSATLPANTELTVVIDARDDVALSDVKLVWDFTQQTFGCNDRTPSLSCTQANGRYTWKIRVGTGQRRFRAIATDTSGNSAETPTRVVTLTSATPPPPPPAANPPPTVSVTRPILNELVTRGGQVVFQAAVADNDDITDVRATWHYAGGSMTYVMAETTTPGLYQALTTVAQGAASGPRSVTIEATDSSGNRTVTSPITVYVR